MDDVTTLTPGPFAVAESAVSEVFVVELAEYSGPLDLLLTLIRDEQIDIYDIPIARIAEQFLARISSLKLDEAADYLEMAARLVRIKAQMLLPRREGEDVRSVKSLMSSSGEVRIAVDVSRGRILRSRYRSRWPARYRFLFPSSSRRSIACCGWPESRTSTTSFHGRSTWTAR